MKADEDVIELDFKTGTVNGAGFREQIGLSLMKLGVFVTRPINYVGFSLGCRVVRSVFSSKRNIRARIDDDVVFEFPYGDFYWSTLLNRKHMYSGDVIGFLHHARDIDYSFLDCGANFGFMSCVVSSKRLGAKKCVAVEADSSNYQRLSQNRSLNHDRFECRHNAVFSKNGEEVQIFGAKHEAMSILSSEGEPTGEMVTTIAPNDFLDWHLKSKRNAIVLKLDVEGVEIEAMKGAGDLEDQNLLVVYEDHGNDSKHEISRYMKDVAGYRIFACDTKTAQEITDYSQLDRLKKNPRVGYDFFATKSPIWLEKFSSYKG